MTQLAKNILNCLIFVETFEHLLEEVDTTPAILADELRGLITKGYIQVMEYDSETGRMKPTLYYDSDNMHRSLYQITGEGMAFI